MVSAAIGASAASRPVDERDRTADAEPKAREADGASPHDRVTISREARARAGTVTKLTPDQQRQIMDLQRRDTHVRQHEAAHQAAGGSLTGAARFSYQQGPDGRSYAVGGEVPIRLQSGRTPDETISNARQARAAALAPSDPSPQDLSVAAAATQLEMSAARQKQRLASEAYAKAAKAARDKEAGGKAGEAASPDVGGKQEEPEPVESTSKAA
jgi:hypothetical protein